MENPGLPLTLIAFVLVIGPLVFVHEMGHYLAGRWFGIKVDAFSIGFGREIAGWTDRLGTRWKIGWLPLGGYVKFAGDMNGVGQPSPEWLALPAEQRSATFQAKPVWQRAIVVAAGPIVNFVAAILILAGFAVAYGDLRGPAVVGSLIAGSPAAAAGLKEGDRITAFNGRSIDSFSALTEQVGSQSGKRAVIGLERDGQRFSTNVTLGQQTVVGSDGKSRVIGLLGVKRPTVSLFAAPYVGARQTVEIVRLMADSIRQILVGQRSFKELGGPIQIAQVSGQQFTIGPDAFVFLIALVSINLGFINLLPVPTLDGGHLLFYAVEAVRRKPVGAQAQEWAFRGGLAAILALMLMVTFNDLGNLGLWRGLGRGLSGLIG